MPITVLIAPDENQNQSVALILGAEDVFLTKEGEPRPGVALTPQLAREIAAVLLKKADEVENLAR